MIHFTCDACGKKLLENEDVRYCVQVEVYAAYDTMELTEDDLLDVHDKEIEELYREIEDTDEEELQNSVYKKLSFDLCPSCQKSYIKDPLFKKRPRIRFLDNEN
jgi:hypothetical protein